MNRDTEFEDEYVIQDSDIPPSDTFGPSFSDDLEALHAQEVETVAEHKRHGIVIQHRRWPSKDVFRSEDERPWGGLSYFFNSIKQT